MIGVTVNDPVMVEQWIAAARESGADNRWELSARTRVAIWRQDWEELGRVANLAGGDRGAMLRGMAACAPGQLARGASALARFAPHIRGVSRTAGPR
jgi:hypothetical protein